MTLQEVIKIANDIAGTYKENNILSFGPCGEKAVQYGYKFPELFPDYKVIKNDDGTCERFVIIEGVKLFQFMYKDELTEHDKLLLKEV